MPWKLACAINILALALLTGCDGCSSPVRVDEGPVIDLKGEKGNVQASMGGALTLPTDFPADLPQPQAAELLVVTSSPQGVTLVMQASDSVGDVLQFYVTTLAEKGWAAPQVQSAAGAHVVSATKENRQVVVSIASESGKTKVTLSASELKTPAEEKKPPAETQPASPEAQPPVEQPPAEQPTEEQPKEEQPKEPQPEAPAAGASQSESN